MRLVVNNYSLLIKELLNKYKNNNVALKDAFSDGCFYCALSSVVRNNNIELVKIFVSNPEVMENFLQPHTYSVGPSIFFKNTVNEQITKM